MLVNYTPIDQSFWTGRLDSKTDTSAFRFHQVVQCIDLNNAQLDNKSGVGIIGFESDLGIQLNQGRPGASKAPMAIRSRMGSLPVADENINIYDCGNVYVGDLELDQAQTALAEAVHKIHQLGLKPLILGGGHETSYGHYLGNSEAFPDSKIGILNFDAHFDNRPYEETGSSSGTMFRQIHDRNTELNLPFLYTVLGIQLHGNTRQLFEYAKESKTDFVFAQEIAKDNYEKSRQAIDRLTQESDHLMITIDMDVFSQAFAPGVSAPQALGLAPNEVLDLLQYAMASQKTISLDIVEVSPQNDIADQTTTLASNLAFYSILNF